MFVRSRCTTFALASFHGKYMTSYLMASFDGKYMTSYLTATVMFAVSTIFEIFAKHIKCQTFDLEHEGQRGEKLDLRHATENILFHIGDFFRILATCEHTFTQKGTNIHTCTHSERHGWWLEEKSAQIRFALKRYSVCIIERKNDRQFAVAPLRLLRSRGSHVSKSLELSQITDR